MSLKKCQIAVFCAIKGTFFIFVQKKGKKIAKISLFCALHRKFFLVKKSKIVNICR